MSTTRTSFGLRNDPTLLAVERERLLSACVP
jgi:hypothetical protein